MFKNLFNKKPVVFQAENLDTYPNKDKYFIRIKPWDWLDKKQIYVASKINDEPTMITMEFWSQEIFLDADGQITVSQFIDIACKQYVDSKMPIPDKLDSVLIDLLEDLVNEVKFVEFRDGKTGLPENIRLPMSKQVSKL